MIGAEAAALVLSRLIAGQFPSDGGSRPNAPADRVEPVELVVEGRPVLFRPTATMLRGPDAERNMQVVFEDVTAETRRHDRMEAYAAQVVVGQEEERRHIAQGAPRRSGPDARSPLSADRQRRGGSGGRRETSRRSPTCARSSKKPSPSSDRSRRDSDRRFSTTSASSRPINQILGEAAERGPFEASFGVTGAARRLPRAGGAAPSSASHRKPFRTSNATRARTESRSVSTSSQAGLRMLVKDDGVGFDLSAEEDRDGTIVARAPRHEGASAPDRFPPDIHSAPGSGQPRSISRSRPRFLKHRP